MLVLESLAAHVVILSMLLSEACALAPASAWSGCVARVPCV